MDPLASNEKSDEEEALEWLFDCYGMDMNGIEDAHPVTQDILNPFTPRPRQTSLHLQVSIPAIDAERANAWPQALLPHTDSTLLGFLHHIPDQKMVIKPEDALNYGLESTSSHIARSRSYFTYRPARESSTSNIARADWGMVDFPAFRCFLEPQLKSEPTADRHSSQSSRPSSSCSYRSGNSTEAGPPTESAASFSHDAPVYPVPESHSALQSVEVDSPATESSPRYDNIPELSQEKLAQIINSFIKKKKMGADPGSSPMSLELQRVWDAALCMNWALNIPRGLVHATGYTTGDSLHLPSMQAVHSGANPGAASVMDDHATYPTREDKPVRTSSWTLGYNPESIKQTPPGFDSGSSTQQFILAATSDPLVGIPRQAKYQEMLCHLAESPDVFMADVPSPDFTVIGDSLAPTKAVERPIGKTQPQCYRPAARGDSSHQKRPAHLVGYTIEHASNAAGLEMSLILCYLFLLAMPEGVPMNVFFQETPDANDIRAASLDDSRIMRALTETAFSSRYWVLDFTSLHCCGCIEQIMGQRKRAFLKRWIASIRNNLANFKHCTPCRYKQYHTNCDHSSEFHQWLHSAGNTVGRLQYIRLVSRSYSSINPESLASAINILKKYAHNLLGAQVDLYIPGRPELQITDKEEIRKLVHCFGELEKLLPDKERLQVLGLEFYPKLKKGWGAARRPWWVGAGDIS